MKQTKKLASLLLALVMVLSLATTAFAAENTTITAPSGSSREYEIYQIFTGDLSGTTLSNVKWGKNGTGTEGEAVSEDVLNALAAVNVAGKTDVEKLEVITQYADLEGESMGTVTNGSSLNVPTGYYLIRDNGPVGEDETYSLHVVQLVGPITITPKTGTTTSDKKVDDKNDSNTAEDATDWQDSADYDIGDTIPFKLSATIASDYDRYTNGYKLTFHDKESAGLTFNADSVKVMVGETVIGSENYTVVSTGLEDGCTFEVRFPNLKTIAAVKANSVITVEYTATLNNRAVIGDAGNPNTSHVTYTNNPNDEQGGENGKTPDDTVIVFTYKTVINKTTKNPNYNPEDENSQEYIPLAGAEFALEKFAADAAGTEEYKGVQGKWVAKTVVKNNEGTTFTFSGLDDGEYRLTETKTPDGYNSIDPIYFTVTAVHDIKSDSPALTELTGNAAKGEITFTSKLPEGSLNADVINQSGTELPSTGGMGTTIFYVVGSILVLAAAVLLITKKRMNTKG